MKKRMIIMLIIVGILFGGIFGFKMFVAAMMKQYFAANSTPIVTVSTTKTEYSEWQPELTATGNIRAIRGVNVTTELAGLVKTIYFTPGSQVKNGEVLVQLNADSDIAQLQSLQATAALAKVTYTRDQAQYNIHAVSKQALDTDAANLKSQTAQAAQQAAIVDKKTIKAPFSGRLGISAINPGQYINPGDKIVTLQQLDPIYVDFYVPQQEIDELKVGQKVKVTSDSFPGQNFSGKITAIDPAADPATRNVQVEATISNAKFQLLPGMFGYVKIDTGEAKDYLTLPQTAISYNSFGDIVYIVEPTEKKDPQGKPVFAVKQLFVKTGRTRGDQVAILEGLKEGDIVVSSGQLKLKNGSLIVINNSVVPSDSPNPVVPEE